MTERTVEPRALQSLNGHLLFRAYCHLRQGWRTFRLDRVGDVLATSPSAGHLPEDPVSDWVSAGVDEGTDVVVVADRLRRYLFESLPHADVVPLDDGQVAVRCRIVDPTFLDRLMVMAGPGARVVSTELSGAGRRMADRWRRQL